MANESELLTVQQAAAALGVSRRRVSAMCKSGLLRATKHGPAWLIRREDLEAVPRRKAGNPRVKNTSAKPE
jgi:excisionase family DNA binding protein